MSKILSVRHSGFVFALFVVCAGLTLTAYAPVNAQGTQVGSISGHIYESDGVTPITSDGWVAVEMFDGGYFHQAAVEPDGSYSITGLPIGNYRAKAYSAGYTLEFYPNAVSTGDPISIISVGAGSVVSGVDFSLEPGGTISGTVYAADGVTPMPNIRVEIEGRWAETCTDINGKYVIYGIPLNIPRILNAGGYNWCGGGFLDHPEIWWGHAFSEEDAQPLTLTVENRHPNHINFILGLINTSTLDGSLSLQGRPAQPHTRWVSSFHVIVTPSGGGASLYDGMVTTDQNGDFVIEGLVPGEVHIWVKGEHTLSNAFDVIVVTGNNNIDLGTLREGDADDSNSVTIADFSILAATFGKAQGQAGYDVRADFNGDKSITIADFSLLATNFSQAGAP